MSDVHPASPMGEPVTAGRPATPRSRVSLEASEVSGDDWTEAMAAIDRDGETDPEMATQVLLMTPAEMEALYKRMKLYYEQGIWSTGTVGAVTAGRPATPAMTPGQAARKAYFYSLYGAPEHPDDGLLDETPPKRFLDAWEASAEVVAAPLRAERDQLQAAHNAVSRKNAELAAERDKLSGSCQLLARVVSDQARALYAAWIDAERGDHDAAKETVTQQIEQVLELHTWNGTETGVQWLERTRDEEG